MPPTKIDLQCICKHDFMEFAIPLPHTHHSMWLISRVGPEPFIYGVYTVFFAGKSPNIWSYTVHIYGSGQPYLFAGMHTDAVCV